MATGCAGGGDKDGREAQTSDTLYTAEAAMEIYDQDPERALLIIDSARLMGNVDDDLATLLKAKVYSQSNSMQDLDTARQMLEGLMISDYVHDPNNREVVLDLLANTTRQQDNYEQCLRWTTEKADLCRRQGRETEALRTEAGMGVLLVELGDKEKGIDKLNRVIASLDGQRKTDEMDACIIALKSKIKVLRKLGREEEVIPLAQHIVNILSDYRKNHADYTANSYRLQDNDEDRESYCDYYTAQAQGYMAHAYASRADKTDSARYYLALFEKSTYGHTLYGRQFIAPTWCLLGDYDKMLATYNEVTAQMGADTLNGDYADILRGRAIAAKAMGNSTAAVGYWQRYAELRDLLNKQLQESKAHEYASRYKLQEERLNTERAEAARNRWGIIALSLGFTVIVVAVFVILLIRQLLYIHKKNAVLAKEITDRIAYEEKFHKLNAEKAFGKEVATQEPVNVAAATPEEMSDSELFEQLRALIVEEHLYLNPQFGRQQLMDRLHLSKESIGAAFSKGSQYTSLASFINELRLLHGAKLLVEHPEMSITEVAMASGFASNITFAHNFKERYALTPTNFREEKQQE